MAQITPGDSVVSPSGWSIWMEWDYNGDGVLDAVEQSSDSIKIHDGASTTLLGVYGPDGTYSPTNAFPLSGGRIAVSYSDPSGNVLFKIYSGFTTVEYTSPSHLYSMVQAIGDADGDGNADVTVYDGIYDTTYLYSGAAPYGLIRAYEGKMRLITPGNVLVFAHNSGNVSFKVYSNATNLVYTSSAYPYAITSDVMPFLYDNDDYADILLGTVSSSWTADFYVFSTNFLGVSEREKETETVLPGLVKNGTLKLDEGLVGATLKVMDVSGRTVATLRVRESRVRLNLPVGVYFYTLHRGDRTLSGKMVILK